MTDYERTLDAIESLNKQVKDPVKARKVLVSIGVIHANGEVAQPYQQVIQSIQGAPKETSSRSRISRVR